MAAGWAGDNTSEQIANTLQNAIARARSEIPCGDSRPCGAECSDEIPMTRHKILPVVCIVSNSYSRNDLIIQFTLYFA